MLKIYVREDLKMRKGKMAAQSAHAIMKLIFEVMKKNEKRMVLENKEDLLLKDFLKNPVVEIVMVKSEDDLNVAIDKSKPFSIVVDSGRTEFNGVKTVTCAAQGIFEDSLISEIVVPHNLGTDIKSKQVFIFNKDIPLTKIDACKLAVITCVNNIYSKLIEEDNYKFYDLTVKNEFNDWILNAFGKICLSVENMNDFNSIVKELNDKNIEFTQYNYGLNNCLCIEAKYPEAVDVVTGGLKLI